MKNIEPKLKSRSKKATTKAVNSKAVQVIYPSDYTQYFSSISSASRALSGNGSNSLRRTLSRRINEGGGYFGKDIWIEAV